MPDEFWDAIWLVLGAAIATTTTYLFNRSVEYKERRSHAFALFVKAFTAVNDIATANSQLQEQLARFKKLRGEDPAPDSVWTAVTPFVPSKRPELSFSGEELALFENDGESIGKLIEILQLRQVLLDSVAVYSERRIRLGNALSLMTSFKNDGSGLIGTTAINLAERPDLHRDISEVNKLCKDVLSLGLEAHTHALALCTLVNEQLPKSFKKGDFKLKMSIPP